ncbi:uncharacterized protein PG986_003879 [Apiospora aurea]|uniref:Cyanovirin-N domain-containing protein n=1 Tax=Apiospora aurea TaxID=335848 RepID=A0ABR1QL03_9PEZI
MRVFSVPLAIAGLLFSSSPAAAENFGASCEMGTVKVTGRTMTGACHAVSGELVCSSLDLNGCVTNSFGQLESPGDGYFYSCRNCSNGKTNSGLFLDDPALLHCDCDAGNNNWPTAVIDMRAERPQTQQGKTCEIKEVGSGKSRHQADESSWLTDTFVSNSNGRLQCGNAIGAVIDC